jgi:hypothetical protein
VVAVSFWPEGFDPRSEVRMFLRLASIDAPSGLARFMIGQDGTFTDTGGNVWYGSQLIEAAGVTLSRDGSAPASTMTLSYFQDPDAPDLIDALHASGDIAVRGSVVRFYLQPINDVAEFYAPVFAPILRATRVASGLTFNMEGDVSRSITLGLEGPFRARASRRGWLYTVADHARLTGSANPSLQYMPKDGQVLEKLYG